VTQPAQTEEWESFDLRIASDVRHIEGVVATIVERCEAWAFAPRQTALQLPVALSEALSNAILRGNGEDPAKEVHVSGSVSTRSVVIEVRDQGEGFDLDACTADATAPEHLEREDGRGLFLMRRLMDRVERFNAEGNVVRLTLYRA
jgi:serine/threonine-protein kinase RsbW